MRSQTESETTVQTPCSTLLLEVCQGALHTWGAREASRALLGPENLLAALSVHLDRKNHHLGMEAQAVWTC